MICLPSVRNIKRHGDLQGHYPVFGPLLFTAPEPQLLATIELWLRLHYSQGSRFLPGCLLSASNPAGMWLYHLHSLVQWLLLDNLCSSISSPHMWSLLTPLQILFWLWDCCEGQRTLKLIISDHLRWGKKSLYSYENHPLWSYLLFWGLCLFFGSPSH